MRAVRNVIATIAALAWVASAAPIAGAQAIGELEGDLSITDPPLQELLDALDPQNSASPDAKRRDGLYLEGAPTRLTHGQSANLKIVKCQVLSDGRLDTGRCADYPTVGTNWSVNGIPGGNAETGLLRSRGPGDRNVYTAPTHINWYEPVMVSVDLPAATGGAMLVKTLELMPGHSEWWVGKISRRYRFENLSGVWGARVAFPTEEALSTGEVREASGAGRRQLRFVGPNRRCTAANPVKVSRGSVIVLDWPQPDGSVKSFYRIGVSPDFGTTMTCVTPEGVENAEHAPAVEPFEFELGCTGMVDIGGIAFMPTPKDGEILSGSTTCTYRANVTHTLTWRLERYPKRPSP